MFGLFRKRATNAAIEAVRPLMAVLSIRGPVRREALHDPYFLGFVAIVTMFHMVTLTKGKTGNLGYVLRDVLKEIGGANYLSIVEANIDFAESRHPEYMRGQRDGEKVCSLTWGIQTTETGSLVYVAPDVASAQSLIQTSFVDYINRKYRSGPDSPPSSSPGMTME